MTEPGADNEQQKPLPNQETSISGKISIEFDTKPFDKIVEAIYKKDEKKEHEEKVSDAIAERQATAQENANGIAKRAMYLSLGIFIVTAGVFIWNIKAVGVAKEAAVAADTSETKHKRVPNP